MGESYRLNTRPMVQVNLSQRSAVRVKMQKESPKNIEVPESLFEKFEEIKRGLYSHYT